jgi:hypothetical protein
MPVVFYVVDSVPLQMLQGFPVRRPRRDAFAEQLAELLGSPAAAHAPQFVAAGPIENGQSVYGVAAPQLAAEIQACQSHLANHDVALATVRTFADQLNLRLEITARRLGDQIRRADELERQLGILLAEREHRAGAAATCGNGHVPPGSNSSTVNG